MLKEFRDFIKKGNAMQVAIGFVMGAAFSAIVKSLVDDLIMPFVSLFTRGVDFNNLFYALDGKQYASLKAAQEAGAATLNYGRFINAILTFLIIAFVLFLIVKAMNRMKKAEEATTKTCPYCRTEIDKAASRCPHCTSELSASVK